MTNSKTDDFLAHYGVKGMKWGVRKKDTRSTETSQQRKASARAVRKFGGEVFDRRFSDTKLDYNKLCTTKVVINANSNLKRFSSRDSSVLKGRTYVSQLKTDQTLCRAVLPAQSSVFVRGGKKNYKAAYELDMTTLTKLSGPSEKERVDIFIELMSEPSIKWGRKEITGRDLLKRVGYAADVKKLTDQELGLKYYAEFNQTAGAEKAPINTAYFNKVKERGYNVIKDDNDRGYLSKSPWILLDPEGTIRVNSVTRLTAD